MDDDDAIQRVLAGDIEAFAVLVDRYRGAVFAITRHVLPDPETQEDVGQEAFLAAFRALRRYDPARSRFSTWLLTIARNRAINELRRARVRAEAMAPPPCSNADEERSPSERLDAALDALPAEQRLAFVLAEVHGLTYEQVATVQEVAVGTVKSRIGRARASLRAALSRDLERTR